LQFSPSYPFVSEIRAWFALLLVDAQDGNMDVFGIEVDFCDAANSDSEVLWLLDMLDWKQIKSLVDGNNFTFQTLK